MASPLTDMSAGVEALDTGLIRLYTQSTVDQLKDSALPLHLLFGESAEGLEDGFIENALQWLARTFQIHGKYELVAYYHVSGGTDKITRPAFRPLLSLGWLNEFNHGVCALAKQETMGFPDLGTYAVCSHVRRLSEIFEAMRPDVQTIVLKTRFKDDSHAPCMDQDWMMKVKSQKFTVVRMREHYAALAPFVFHRLHYK